MNKTTTLEGANHATSQTQTFGGATKLFTILCLLLFSTFTTTAQPPTGFVDQLFLDGWSQVVGFTWDANGRMYVWQKDGTVWIVENGVRQTTPLLDISEEVGNWRDFGMLGFALDPDFLTNGYYYLCYVVDRHHLLNFGTGSYNSNTDEYFNATIGRVTRYQADVATNFTTTVSGSRQVLLGETKETGMPILHESHGTGHIVFGTDGTLIVCMGDGASYSSLDQGSASETYWSQAIADGIITAAENIGAYRCQVLFSHNGKIFRLDPTTGDGVPSNPYYDSNNPRSPQSRTWARGVRNPYRITKKPNTGSHNPADGDPGVFAFGDVGWGTWEDLHIVDAAGQNFGWPKFEGINHQPGYNNPTYTPSTHDLPKVDWKHGANDARGVINGSIFNVGSAQLPGTPFAGNASTSGFWYEGTDFPPEYQGSYFHADYGSGWIRNFLFDSNHNPTLVREFNNNAGPVVFLDQPPIGDGFFYVKYPNEIRKVTYAGSGNLPPVADAQADVNYGMSPLTVQFTGDQSYDPELGQLSYDWNFGDGSTSTAANPVHTFTGTGIMSYTTILTVTDNQNQTHQSTVLISMNNTPPNIQSTSLDNVNAFDPNMQTTLNLNATVSDSEHSAGQLTYAWQTSLFHNDHSHAEPIDNNVTTTTTLSPIGCTGATYWYQVQLTVTDPEGLSSVFTKNLYPNCSGTSQTVSLSPISDKTIFNAPFTLNATASSGLPTTLYIADGPALLSGNTVTLLGIPGTVTIRATQPGDATYAPAVPVEQSFKVVPQVLGGVGLQGTYFDNINLTNQVLQRTDSEIHFDWGTGSPDPSIGSNTFSVRWEGDIFPLFSETYTFHTRTDDGVRLWVNNQLIIDEWIDQSPTIHSGTIALTAGQKVSIVMEYYENGGGAVARLEWESGSQLREVVPEGVLFPPNFQADQTITFLPIPDKATTDPPFNITATASSGLPVSFNIVSGPATVTGSTVTLVGTPGTVIIRASQAGNANYNPAPDVEQSFDVVVPPPLPSITITSPTEGELLTGSDVTVTYTTGGDWNFYGANHLHFILDNPPHITVPNVNGSYTLTNVPAGAHTLTVQIANSSHQVLTNPEAMDVVNFTTQDPPMGDIDLELNLSPTPSEPNIYTNFTVTATLVNNSIINATNVRVHFPKPDGVVFTGGNPYSASQGIYNVFTNQEWAVGNLPAGATATLNLNFFLLQSTPITAYAQVVAAGENDVDSTPNNGACCVANEDDEAVKTIPDVGTQDQTITFPPISNKIETDPPFQVSATASSGLPVSFSILSGPATISGNTITLTGALGTVIVRASQTGNATYNPAPNVDQSFTVNEAPSFFVSFSDETSLLNNPNDFNSGVAMGIADMNGDGLDDIIRLDNASNLNIEYQNAPNTAFSHLTFGNLGSGTEWSLCIADADKNGFNDILAGGSYNNLKLLKANSSGTNFTSSTLPNSNIFLQGSNFADINNDGSVDIFACHDDAESRPYENDGSGNFTYNASLISTVTVPASDNSGNYASIWTDYDNDGDLDLYISKCRINVNNATDPRRINLLFQNDGANNFTEVAQQAGLKIGAQSWATDFADIDNDGDLDCFVINHDVTSQLLENNGNGTFTDITNASGMVPDLNLFGIQALFKDFDNDGFVDLVIAGSAQRMFKNNGDKTFTRVTNPFNANEMESLAIGDLNHDGFLDIYAGYAALFNSPTTIDDRLFMNGGNSNNWCAIDLVGTVSNVNGIGARIELHGTWGVQIREVRSGEGYGIMNSFTRFFGIGIANAITKVVVKWPSGIVNEVQNPTPNQFLTITETPIGANDIDLELSLVSNNNSPNIYTNYTVTATLTNNSVNTATNVRLKFDRPTGTVYVGGNPYTASQGTFDPNSTHEWTVGTLAAGATATLNINLFVLTNNSMTSYAQVIAATEDDSDSTPNNGTCCIALEDDEAAITVPDSGPQDQIISFPTIPDKFSDDPPFQVSATASSGLPVSFSIESGPATISGSTITLTGALGFVTVKASQAGDANYNPAPDVFRTFNVSDPGLQNQTINFPAIPNKITTDPPFQISATATSGLPVSFSLDSGPATISGNTITLNGTAGTVVVRATQAGNASYNPASDVTQSFQVNPPIGQNDIDLELSATADKTTLDIWKNTTFTLTLTNNGNAVATNLRVDAPIPTGTAFTSATASKGSYNVFFKRWDIPDLAIGESATLDLVLFVLQNTTPIDYFTQVTAATENDADSTPNNGTCCTPAEDDEAVHTLDVPTQAATGSAAFVFSLSAQREGTITQLVWVNNSGERNDQFVLERSTNGIDFQPIKTRHNLTDQNYFMTYRDRDLFPHIGINYYRVRLDLKDGSYLYSPVQAVEFDTQQHDFKVFPNPANAYLEVSLRPLIGAQVKLRIFDRMGRELYFEAIESAAIEPHRIELERFEEGSYFLVIESDTKRAVVLQFMVGRV